jgi:transcriptional regulator with XRE-family HTH domain
MTRMTGGELWIARDRRLGLGRAELAQILNVTPAAVAGWEQGKSRVPHRVTETISDLKTATDAAIANLVAELRAMADPQVTIYWPPDATPPGRTEAAKYGFGWWRHVVDRAIEQVPETRVGTPEEIAGIRGESLDVERSDRR